MRVKPLLFLCFIVQSCAPALPRSDQETRLSAFFDCVRESNGVLISAHRGGPVPGFAENSLSTFRNTAKDGLSLLEIDVRTSSDGVLFLLHDKTLDRTTTGRGIAERLRWAALRRVELLDESGKRTGAKIPDLRSVLIWARSAPVVLQLDIKGRTEITDLVQLIRRAGMSQRVMLITYNQSQALKASRIAPDMALSVGIKDIVAYKKLLAGGVKTQNILAWTGTFKTNPPLYAALSNLGVEVIFGALGRIDERAARDGSGVPYQMLVENGVHIIATDRAYSVRRALVADDRAERLCPLPQPDAIK